MTRSTTDAPDPSSGDGADGSGSDGIGAPEVVRVGQSGPSGAIRYRAAPTFPATEFADAALTLPRILRRDGSRG